MVQGCHQRALKTSIHTVHTAPQCAQQDLDIQLAKRNIKSDQEILFYSLSKLKSYQKILIRFKMTRIYTSLIYVYRIKINR